MPCDAKAGVSALTAPNQDQPPPVAFRWPSFLRPLDTPTFALARDVIFSTPRESREQLPELDGGRALFVSHAFTLNLLLRRLLGG